MTHSFNLSFDLFMFINSFIYIFISIFLVVYWYTQVNSCKIFLYYMIIGQVGKMRGMGIMLHTAEKRTRFPPCVINCQKYKKWHKSYKVSTLYVYWFNTSSIKILICLSKSVAYSNKNFNKIILSLFMCFRK